MRTLPSALAVLLLAFAGPVTLNAQTPRTVTQSPATLRIGLWTLWHDKQLTVAPVPNAAATLRLCPGCTPTPFNQDLLIRTAGAGLELPGNRHATAITLSGTVRLVAHGETLALHNPLRVSSRNRELVLAVTLPIESYVERVVASESSPADSPESLKALAIVVRSFALHEPHGHADYDLCDSTHCQLLHWGANSGREAAAHAATLATAGETLWFHGKPAAAWFHQNCGGRTASPAEAWPDRSRGNHPDTPSVKTMPWLVSHTDPFCTANGAREWAADLTLADLTTALATQGLVRPGWTTLKVGRRGESGRAVTLFVGSTEISAEDFRLAVGRTMGWGHILSSWFEVSQQGDKFMFHGRGSGHGVGLCQAGAAVMGAQGHDSSQILSQYFPGAVAADENTGLEWQTMRGSGFVLETLEPSDSGRMAELAQALADAESRSDLAPAGPITVRAFRSVEGFRNATLAPGWVAAFTEGNWIGTQPLSTLAARKLMIPVLRHEFLHALVEGHAAPGTPLWLREGLVEALAESDPANARSPGAAARNGAAALNLDQVNQALAHSATESQSEAAHRAAAWYAGRLLARFGRAQVVGWLHSGLPENAIATIR